MNNSEVSLPHSELEPAALVELATAVGQWLGAESAPDDVIRTQERVVEWAQRLVEQYETVRELNRRAEERCADAFMEARGLKEQLEAAQRERDEYRAVNESVRVCAAHTSEIVGKGDCVICDLEGAYRRGIARGVQVADAESNPARERP